MASAQVLLGADRAGLDTRAPSADLHRTECLLRTADHLPIHLPTFLRRDAIVLPGWCPHATRPRRGAEAEQQ